MNCKKAKEQINRLFDGFEIKDSLLLSHLKNCKTCLKEYNAVLKITKALDTKEKIKVPYNFNNKVWNKIGEPRPTVFNFMDRILIPKPVFAAAFAAIFFLVLFGISIVRNNYVNEEKDRLVYNINKKVIADKKTIPTEKQVIEKQGIKESEINKQIEQTGISPATEEKKIVKKEETKKDEEIIYNTFVRLPEDVKTGYPAGEKITIAEVKKEPEKIETTDLRYFREDYKILDNVINPLKGEKVIIRYKIQNQVQVKIAIYDRSGELVRQLINENKNTGVYETAWDGKDTKGNIIGAGIYYIYLKTDIVEKKIKTLVIK